MAGSEVGELKIALSFDGKKLKASQSKITSEVENSGKKFEGVMSKSEARMIGFAASAGTIVGQAVAGAIQKVGSAVIDITKQAFSLYGEYEQLVGGIETLFGDAADTVVANSKKAFKTAQISANEYMSTATSFSASLLQSLGGDTKKAAEYADRAIIDMADNANKMGTSMESIQNAYQGFAKQNYTMLDNLKLGYGGTKTEMERLIADASKMTEVQKELGITVQEGNMDFGNMVNAISVVQKKLGIMGTSAAEASKTVQGSFNQMKSSWQNFLTALGDPNGDVDKAMNDLVESVETFLDNAIPVLDKIFEKIIDKLPDLVDMIVDKLPDLIERLVPKLLEGIVKIVMKLAVKLPEILWSLVVAILQAIPKMVAAIVEGFGQSFENIGQFFEGVFTNLGQFFSGMWEGLQQGAAAAWQGIQNIFGGIAEWFGNVFRGAWNAVKAVFETGGKIFSGIVEGIIATFKTVVNGIISGINFVVAIPFNAINGFLNILKSINILGIKPFDWVGTIAVPQIPLLADGGYASGASQAIIGEEGKEVVLPLENNTDNWSGLLANALADRFNEDNDGVGKGVTIETQNINIDSKLDAENIGHIMMQSIRRQAR